MAGIALAATGLGQTPTTWTTGRVLSGAITNACAYDLARQRVVLFGGVHSLASGAPAMGTWELDRNGWLQRTPATSPSARYGHSLAYDMSRRRIVLYGGMGVSGLLADTWEWDGASWVERATVASPPARRDHALAYDMARQRVVLFGGWNGIVAFGDTWEWDGQSWVQRSSAVSPPARQNHALAYDVGRKRLVLFGGGRYGTWLADTWEWDGTSWQQQAPATSPPGMFGHAMAYELVRQRVVLVGGEGQFGFQADTWEWNGTTWTMRTPAMRPSARTFPGLAYDMARNRVVLFGGTRGMGGWPLSDTWEWDGTTWTRQPETSPLGRDGHALAYDAERRETVLFGGLGHVLHDDTWTWDGASWTRRSPAMSPPGRFYHAMAWDAARKRLVVFGGRWEGFPGAVYGDTWEWDGASWSQMLPATSPSARSWHSMAYDAARRRVVLFGGGDTAITTETWEWDGITWTQHLPPTSPSILGHAAAYDSVRQRVMLVGGASVGPQVETWEWDGVTWKQRVTSGGPSPRFGMAAAFDAARQRVVLFGGRQGTVYSEFSDTWEWDGTSWSEQSPPAKPIARAGHAVAYDSARQRVVLFGGRLSDGMYLGDTAVYGPAGRATASPFGMACPGSNGSPLLTSNEPFLGNARLVLDILSANASAPCMIGLAGDSQRLAIGGGCTLYLKEPILPILAVSNTVGFASVWLAVPNDLTLRAVNLYAQGFVVDAQGPVLGLAMSGGRRLVLGD